MTASWLVITALIHMLHADWLNERDHFPLLTIYCNNYQRLVNLILFLFSFFFLTYHNGSIWSNWLNCSHHQLSIAGKQSTLMLKKLGLNFSKFHGLVLTFDRLFNVILKNEIGPGLVKWMVDWFWQLSILFLKLISFIHSHIVFAHAHEIVKY